MARQEEDWSPEKPIPYEQTGSVMTTLGFLSYNIQPDSADFALFQELWEVLDGENREGVTQNNLLYALLIIRGFKFPEREVNVDPEEGRQGIAKQAAFGNDELVIRVGGTAKIFAHFKNLWVNRILFEGESKKRVPVATVELKAAPQISEKSKKLAEESRKKYVSGEEMATDIVSYLYDKEQTRQAEKEAINS